MDNLRSDLRTAARMFRAHPWTVVAAIIMLALGMGASAAIFAVVRAVLLRPLPFAEPSRLVMLWEQDQNAPVIEVSFANFEDWRSQNRTFADMAAIGSVNWDYTLHGRPTPRHVTYAPVSVSFFDVVGVKAALGRTFVPNDDEPDAARVVVLSHGFWRRQFGGDPKIIGRTVTLEGAAPPAVFSIVGVMAPGFDFPRGADLWTPVKRELAAQARHQKSGFDTDRGYGVLYVIGRLKPGVDVSAARVDIDALGQRLRTAYQPASQPRRAIATSVVDYVFGQTRVALSVLSGAVVLVLIIACANVASLLAVLGVGRRHEMALRMALGAARARITRQLLTESALLTGVATLLGMVLAWWAVRGLVSLSPADVPGLDAARVDGRVFVFALVLGALTAIGVGLTPAWRAAAQPVADVLKDTTARMSAGRRLSSTRGLIVGAQLAMATVVLVGSALMMRSFMKVSEVDLGFTPRNVLTLTVVLPDSAYPTIASKRGYFEQLLPRILALPGVESAGAIYQRPFSHGPIGMDSGIIIEGQPLESATFQKNPLVNWQSVTPGYFEAMGMPIVRGRNFTNADRDEAPRVVIVSEGLARRMWPGQDAVGKRLLTLGAGRDAQGRPRFQTVVGVVNDARYRELELPRLDVYVPYLQAPIPVKDLVVRTASDPLPLLSVIQRNIRESQPDLLAERADTMTAVVSRVVAPWRFNMIVFAMFGALALVLTAGGLFGLIAHSVTQRTREIVVRIALGARSRDVLVLILREALVLAVCGITIGVTIAYALGRLVSRMLFGVSPTDLTSFVLVALLVLIITFAATHFPARRAARLDPTTALKA
jgi:putative ABC transport system permease protein